MYIDVLEKCATFLDHTVYATEQFSSWCNIVQYYAIPGNHPTTIDIYTAIAGYWLGPSESADVAEIPACSFCNRKQPGAAVVCIRPRVQHFHCTTDSTRWSDEVVSKLQRLVVTDLSVIFLHPLTPTNTPHLWDHTPTQSELGVMSMLYRATVCLAFVCLLWKNWFVVSVCSFGQLILRKIIEIGATTCQILTLKCTKFEFRWGSAPDPTGGAYSAPPDLRSCPPVSVF